MVAQGVEQWGSTANLLTGNIDQFLTRCDGTDSYILQPDRLGSTLGPSAPVWATRRYTVSATPQTRSI